ncbi:MAG: DNA (cytosine-5-)-methyltransferase [Prevotella sp.]|nr:DNA (cytosine-5-)-methyltransferase [Prevotella sp.]
MARLKVASFFCGCGGMDLGLLGNFDYLDRNYSKLNYEIVYAVDNDPYCTQMYNLNFEHKCIVEDVRNIELDHIPDFDLLIGGFPCQSFSISAQNPPRLGYKDERGMLFFEMVKALKEKRPRFFIAENVKGILSANNKKAFPMILKEFQEVGYKVKYQLLNSSNYGIPQKRERVIIVGFRDDEDFFKFRFPVAVTKRNKIPLRTAIDIEANENDRWFFSAKAVEGLLASNEKMNKGRIQNLDEPCNTISSHLAKVSLNSTDPVLFINGRYRRLTPRECARVQSFPESYDLSLLSDGRKYKAIGNAVPPVMMWYVSKALQETASKANVGVDFKAVHSSYPNSVVTNDSNLFSGSLQMDKRVLIGFVKKDNVEHYLNNSAKIYYTGKKFPSTVALNKLYYFMPYVEGKGIRDLYLIKIARVGTRKEGQPDNDPNDLRLVFEIEYVLQFLNDYKKVKLKIWRTFTDTTLRELKEFIEKGDK